MDTIPTIDYSLSDDGSTYIMDKTIYFGFPSNNNLTNSELIAYMSDVITHEYIHHVISNLYSETMSCMFDAIGDYLRNFQLLKKAMTNYRLLQLTWTDAINIYGFNKLIKRYRLNKLEVNKILNEG